MTLTERLNLTNNKNEIVDRAVKLDGRKDINYWDTLNLYCTDNNIDLKKIDDRDFEECADCIEAFAKSAAIESLQTYFWIDNVLT
jgi:hypothetical protein